MPGSTDPNLARITSESFGPFIPSVILRQPIYICIPGGRIRMNNACREPRRSRDVRKTDPVGANNARARPVTRVICETKIYLFAPAARKMCCGARRYDLTRSISAVYPRSSVQLTKILIASRPMNDFRKYGILSKYRRPYRIRWPN